MRRSVHFDAAQPSPNAPHEPAGHGPDPGARVLNRGECGLDVSALISTLHYTQHRSAPEIHCHRLIVVSRFKEFEGSP
jgi:hypothetical protein